MITSRFFTTFVPLFRKNMERKLILITNDDGVSAQGITVLTDLMAGLGEVVVVAPDSARSGAACAITSTQAVTLHRRGDMEREGVSVYVCSGSPVDCVKLALEQVCPRRPDLLVSGINHGDNASCSIHYSGTMGAVIEGCMKGIPSIGFSLRTLKHKCDFSPYAEDITRIAHFVLTEGLPQDVCLNVNFPEVAELAGMRVCRMGRGRWVQEWISANNPRGMNAFWLTGRFLNLEPHSEDTDYWALDHGYGAITPIKLDMTAYEVMPNLMSLTKEAE